MTDNPFKIIGLALLISILSLYGIFELPKLLLGFNQSEWLTAAIFALLLTISALVNVLGNTQKLNQHLKPQAKRVI